MESEDMPRKNGERGGWLSGLMIQASILPPYHHPFSPSFLFLTTYSFLEAEMEVGAGKDMREWARRWMAIQPSCFLSHLGSSF